MSAPEGKEQEARCPKCGSKNFDWKDALKVGITLKEKPFMGAPIEGQRRCEECGEDFNIYEPAKKPAEAP